MSSININDPQSYKEYIIQNGIDIVSPIFYSDFFNNTSNFDDFCIFLYKNLFDSNGGKIGWINMTKTNNPAVTVNNFLTPDTLKVYAIKRKPNSDDLIYSAYNTATAKYEIRVIKNILTALNSGIMSLLNDQKITDTACPAKDFSFRPNPDYFGPNQLLFECGSDIYIIYSISPPSGPLTKLGQGTQPRFSADGHRIFFTRPDGIYKMDGTGASMNKINDGGYSPISRWTSW